MASRRQFNASKSKQDYVTPADFIEAVKRKLKIVNFDIDLAANASNTKAVRWLGPGGVAHDALDPNIAWNELVEFGGWAWLNPPFKNMKPWAQKCCEVNRHNVVQIAMLAPAGVSTHWFHDYVHDKALVLLPLGRLEFLPDKPAMNDCILALYGFQLRGYRTWDWNRTK